MGTILSFRDLRVYVRAREEAKKIFAITRTFPKDERYSLTDQIRRLSRAVSAMVAEAWARRKYQAAFINKIDEAMGKAMETQAWLDHAFDCLYLNRFQHQDMDKAWQDIGGMLRNMITRSKDFCERR